MPDQAPLPASLEIKGVPYWGQHGGSPVTMLGGAATAFMEGERGIEQMMRERGHFVTNVFSSLEELKTNLPHMYEGELGLLVVVDKVPSKPGKLDDVADLVPNALKELDQNAPTIFMPITGMTQNRPDILRGSGYDVVLSPRHPSEAFRRAAAEVTRLARAAA